MMPFLAFELIFGIVAIALVALTGLIVRAVRRKRQADSPQAADAPAEPEPARASRASLEKAAAPEPQSGNPPAPRRRQLASFAEAATDETRLVLAEVATALPSAPSVAIGSDAAALARTALDDRSEYDLVVLARLEEAFEALQAGTLSLEAYMERLQTEAAEIEQRIAALGDDGDPGERDVARAAQESVHWCLDWAHEQAQLD
jgi:hypothetical protein